MSPARLVAITLTAASILTASCGRVDRAGRLDSLSNANGDVGVGSKVSADRPCVNINTATAAELESLPGVGEVIGRKIVEHRARNGPFRRAEELMIIEGFSERKYRQVAALVCVE